MTVWFRIAGALCICAAFAPSLDAQEIPAIWQSPGADRRHGLMAPARPTGACGPSGDDWR